MPAEVLEAEQQAKNHAVPHVNFYDPSVYKVGVPGPGAGRSPPLLPPGSLRCSPFLAGAARRVS